MAINSIPVQISHNAVDLTKNIAKKAKNNLVPIIKAVVKPILFFTGGIGCAALAGIFATKSIVAFASVPITGPVGVSIGLFDLAMTGLLFVGSSVLLNKAVYSLIGKD